MSKEIFLYSGDNKYQAYVELADSTDRFGCPDHSLFKLIENRNDDKLYLIAEARDGLLETEKDQRIAELEKQLDQLKQQLEEKDKDLDLTANELIEIKHKLKQQLEEKDKEIKRVTKIDNKTFLFETYEKPLREQIQLLKQQLVEKQSKIDEMSKEFVQAVHAVYDWRVLCAEKDKEIERLKNLFELNNEVVINQGKEIFDLRVQVLQQKQNQTQLAIQELEKVKILIQNAINFVRPNFVEVYDAINKQINDLKGEKEVED